jgi:tetratricopeptide (TPR) repeat protein
MIQRWNLPEQVLRGVFLALVLTAGRQLPLIANAALLLTTTLLPMTLVVCGQLWNRRRFPGLFPAGLLLSIIDSPLSLHWAAPVGLATGMFLIGTPAWEILGAAIVGTLIGSLIFFLYRIRSPMTRRIGMILFLTGMVLAGIAAFQWDWVEGDSLGRAAGIFVLGSALIYYLLLFAGRSEEAEFDIGLVSLLLALGLASLIVSRTGRSIVVLGPVALYAIYCEKARVGLVVFKHVLRGMDQEQRKRWRDALIEYRAALLANPQSPLAIEGSWRVHQQMDVADLARQKDLAAIVDPEACLERVRKLLNHPSIDHAQAKEIEKLLDIVDYCDSARRWQTTLARVKLDIRSGEIDAAIDRARPLRHVHTDALEAISSSELDALLDIWSLVLQDPLLVGRSGDILSDGGVSAFLTAAEMPRKSKSGSTTSEQLRPFLYRKLTLADYRFAQGRPGTKPFPKFDRAMLIESARGLARDGEPAAAVELWEIVAIEFPEIAFSAWSEAANLAADHQADPFRRRIHDSGLNRGINHLSVAERTIFDRTIKQLAEEAHLKGDVAEAVRLFEIFALSSSSGIQTRERLLHLYLQQNDRLSAIRQVEAILLYDLADSPRAQWLEKRNDLYSKIQPEDIRPRALEAQSFFHFRYCSRRAAQLLEQGYPNDQIDHYLQLAELGPPTELRLVNYVLAKRYARDGEHRASAACLEAACLTPPDPRADEEEKLAYHRSCRLLGEICIQQLQDAERGVKYLLLYKDQIESGADTLFLLGQGYEMLGHIPQARKWYDMVTVYPGHPRAADAREALARLADP